MQVHRERYESSDTPQRRSVLYALVMGHMVESARAAAQRAAELHPDVALFVLFGSRAREDARPDSDWDVAFAATSAVNALALRLTFVDLLGTDRVDLVDVKRASALLRYRVARDGVLLFEREPGRFAGFWMESVQFWCDVAPLVRAGGEEILTRLES